MILGEREQILYGKGYIGVELNRDAVKDAIGLIFSMKSKNCIILNE